MTFPVDSLLRLIQGLLDSTSSGDVKWDIVGSDAYLLGRRSGGVVIATRDGDGQAPFVLRLLNPEGDVVEEVEESIRLDATLRIAMRNLYGAARSSARNVEPLINDLLNDLKK